MAPVGTAKAKAGCIKHRGGRPLGILTLGRERKRLPIARAHHDISAVLPNRILVVADVAMDNHSMASALLRNAMVGFEMRTAAWAVVHFVPEARVRSTDGTVCSVRADGRVADALRRILASTTLRDLGADAVIFIEAGILAACGVFEQLVRRVVVQHVPVGLSAAREVVAVFVDKLERLEFDLFPVSRELVRAGTFDGVAKNSVVRVRGGPLEGHDFARSAIGIGTVVVGVQEAALRSFGQLSGALVFFTNAKGAAGVRVAGSRMSATKLPQIRPQWLKAG